MLSLLNINNFQTLFQSVNWLKKRLFHFFLVNKIIYIYFFKTVINEFQNNFKIFAIYFF